MAVKKKLPRKEVVATPAQSPAKSYALAGIVIFTALVFSNSIKSDFLAFDDFDYVVKNPYIKSLSWESIKEIFTSFYYANYHPLTTLTYAIEYNLFKTWAPGYHLINLLLHLSNVCLVYILLKKLSAKREVAVIGALFFGIHPMHVESVAWISERKDVLYSFFYIAGLITYLKYIAASSAKDSNESKRYLIYTVILFLLSLLSKPAANTFPLLLVLFDFYFKRKWNKHLILEKIPFFLLAAAFGIITILAQHEGGALTDITRPHYSVIERFFVVCYALAFYIVRFFLPVNLCALQYAPRELPVYYYLSPLIIAAIVWLVIRAKAFKRELIFALLFYLFTLILVIQIIPIGYVNVSERYSYIPYIGLLFIVGNIYTLIKAPSKKYILAGVAIIFAILSFQRNKIWHDTLTLFKDNSEKNPNSSQAQFVLGEKLYEIGEIKGSLDAYNRSIELDSTVAPVYFWRGNAYNRLENYPAAIADFLKAAQLKANYLEAYNNIGAAYMKTKDYPNAIIYFGKSIAIKPSEFLYQNRGTSYFYLKQYKEAIDDYTKALEINPQITDAYFNRGVCFLYLQQINKACDDWSKASAMGYPQATDLLNKYCAGKL